MTKSPRKSCPGGENYMETGAAGGGLVGREGGWREEEQEKLVTYRGSATEKIIH